MFQGIVNAVSNSLRFRQSAAFGKENLHGELFAVGIGHGAEFQLGEDEEGNHYDSQTSSNSQPRMAEGPVKDMVIGVLHPAGDSAGMS